MAKVSFMEALFSNSALALVTALPIYIVLMEAQNPGCTKEFILHKKKEFLDAMEAAPSKNLYARLLNVFKPNRRYLEHDRTFLERLWSFIRSPIDGLSRWLHRVPNGKEGVFARLTVIVMSRLPHNNREAAHFSGLKEPAHALYDIELLELRSKALRIAAHLLVYPFWLVRLIHGSIQVHPDELTMGEPLSGAPFSFLLPEPSVEAKGLYFGPFEDDI
jgi:hypothetical protein